MAQAAQRRLVRRSPRGRSTRAPGSWARTFDSLTSIAVSSKTLLGQIVLSNPGINETVRRVLGTIYVQSDQLVANERQIGAFGMAVVSDLALAAGAASIPGPVTDASDDGWFLWQPINWGNGSDATQIWADHISYAFDSRAMRRVQEGYGIAIMVENADAAHVFQIQTVLSLYATRTR